MNKLEYDIFVSYSRKDFDKVYSVVTYLKDKGFSIWIDQKGIESGDAFASVLVTAIEKSKVVLFFSSESSNVSEWTAREIAVAHSRNKKIIPVKLDNSLYNRAVEMYLILLDYVDLTNSGTYSNMLDRLTHSLEKECSKQQKSKVTVGSEIVPSKKKKGEISGYQDLLKSLKPEISFQLKNNQSFSMTLDLDRELYFAKDNSLVEKTSNQLEDLGMSKTTAKWCSFVAKKIAPAVTYLILDDANIKYIEDKYNIKFRKMGYKDMINLGHIPHKEIIVLDIKENINFFKDGGPQLLLDGGK